MAFTGVVALASAETVTAAMVFAAVAEVGTAMSIVGAVTGDKTLASLGGVMALGGAAGGFLSGLGAVGDAAATTAGGATVGEGIEAGFMDAANVAGDTAGTVADTVGSVAMDGGGELAGDAALDANGLGATQPLANTATSVGTAVTPTAPVVTPSVGNSLEVNGAAAPTGPTGPVTPLDNPISSTGAPASSNDFFGNIWQGIKDPKNKTLVNSAMQIGGGLLQGIGQADQFNRALDVKNREQTLNEQVKLGQLALQQQLAANANSQVKFPGIVASARN